MPTIFSKIIRGELPCYKVAENEQFYAFLDIRPSQLGHTLVVPKRAEDYFFDLTDEELANMMSFCKQISEALRSATACKRIALSVVGLEVNHAHVHLIPINEPRDMNLAKTIEVSADHMARVRDSIRSYLPPTLL